MGISESSQPGQPPQAAKRFSDLEIKSENTGLKGDKIKIERIFNREIIVEAYIVKPSEYTVTCLHLQFTLNGNRHVLFSGSQVLQKLIERIPKSDFPFITTIVKQDDNSYLFT